MNISVETKTASGQVIERKVYRGGVLLSCDEGGEMADGAGGWCAPQWTRLWVETPDACLGTFTPATGGTLEIGCEEMA